MNITKKPSFAIVQQAIAQICRGYNSFCAGISLVTEIQRIFIFISKGILFKISLEKKEKNQLFTSILDVEIYLVSIHKNISSFKKKSPGVFSQKDATLLKKGDAT